MTSPPPREILTLKEVAVYLKVNPRRIYRLLSDGRVPAFRVGHAWRFRRAAVDAWAQAVGNPTSSGEAGYGNPRAANTAFDLGAPCGRHFTFREFVECGDTWHRLDELGLGVDNVPAASATFDAIRELCRVVVDPVADRFGLPELTYAFASAALTKHIGSRICPARDQHAGCELTRRGVLICPRSGMAVDLRVPGVSARTLASWIAQNAAFDRIYIYGPDQPIHVSIGPEQARAIVSMTPTAGGRVVPRLIRTLS